MSSAMMGEAPEIARGFSPRDWLTPSEMAALRTEILKQATEQIRASLDDRFVQLVADATSLYGLTATGKVFVFDGKDGVEWWRQVAETRLPPGQKEPT